MDLQSSCPDSGRLKELLDGNLEVSEQTGLNEHLETCVSCQQTLEGLAAGSDSWSEAARQLAQEEPPPDGALQRVMAAMQGESSGEARQEVRTAHDDPALDWLSPATGADHIGRLGSYQVTEVIGRGGMGVVLKAFDPTLNRFVAIKVLAPALANSASARKRFLREARAAAAISHENVIAIYAVEEANGLPYLVMPYIRGTSLQERLDSRGALPLTDILRFGTQMAAGLAAAHAEGLIHRDIKPANILLENGERVRITDFGLARSVHDGSLTQAGVVAGTPQYMAPEQARGEPLDSRADLFSLGSVLYAMCTGQAPFQASNNTALLRRVCEDRPRPIQEINAEILDWLVALIAKLHAKDPADRFGSAAEVAELLSPNKRSAFNLQRSTSKAHSATWKGRRWAVAAGVLLLVSLALGTTEATGLTRVTGVILPLFHSRSSEPTSDQQLVEDKDASAQAGASRAAQVPKLRYHWQSWKIYIYAVRIEATQGDIREVMEGNSIYSVPSVKPGDITLSHQGVLFPLRTRQGMPAGMAVPRVEMPSPMSGFGPLLNTSELHTDVWGRISKISGSSKLPYRLGDLAQLVIEPLETTGKATWQVTKGVTIDESDEGTSRFPFRPRGMSEAPFGPRRIPRPSIGRTGNVTWPAQERSVYTLRNPLATTVLIEKEYELTTDAMVDGKPRIQLAGRGRITFDVKMGLPLAATFKATLSEQTANGSSRSTPITVTYRLVEGKERERMLHPPPPPKIEPKPMTDSDLSRALADLKSSESFQRQNAADRLSQAVANKRKVEVAKALEGLLDDPWLFTRTAGAKALGVWGSKENVPALLKTLRDKEAFPRAAAIEALGQLKDERAIEPIAVSLADFFDRATASKVLQAWGPRAEKAVLGQLQHRDGAVRTEACKILKVIGTTESVPELQAATGDSDKGVAQAAQEALRTIGRRQEVIRWTTYLTQFLTWLASSGK